MLLCLYLYLFLRLGNGEVTLVMAQQASCLRKKDFNRALQILRAALEHEEISKKAISYGTILEHYVSHSVSRKQLESFCQQAETQLKELGSKTDFKSKDSTCIMVYWACAAAQVRFLFSLSCVSSIQSSLSGQAVATTSGLLSSARRRGQENRARVLIVHEETFRTAQANISRSQNPNASADSFSYKETHPSRRHFYSSPLG